MRKLVYVCNKAGSTVKVNSMVQANELKLGGWKVEETLETIPEDDKKGCDPLQWERRVKI